MGVTVASNHHSCSMGGHTNPHQERTTTNEQNMNEWGYAPMFRRHALIYFFSSMWINLRKHLPDPHLALLSVAFSSWTLLIKTFMSRVWQEYYYFHYLYYGHQARKKKKNIRPVELVQKLSVPQSPVWFMIDLWYAVLRPLQAQCCKKKSFSQLINQVSI